MDVFWPALLAALAANLVSLVVIYAIWSYRQGHSVPRAMLNTGAGILGLIGLAVRFYFIALAAFVSLMFAKWLLIG